MEHIKFSTDQNDNEGKPKKPPLNAYVPGHDTQIELAEARTEQAEARTERADARTEQAEARSARADSRTEQAEVRTEQAEVRTEQAKARTEQAETRTEQAETRTELAKARTEQAEARTEQAETRTEQAETQSEQAEVRTERAEMASIRLAAIVESSGDAIIGKDLTSIITSWNKGAEKIFGYAASEMVGTSIMRLIPSDRKEEENQILGKIKRGETLSHFETIRQTKDGQMIDVSVTASPIKDATGKVIGMSKVARNITQRKRAQAEICRLNESLEQRVAERTAQLESVNEELGTFSYSVSHDLRAPLRQIMGFVKILQEDAGPSLSEENLLHLTTIFQSATRMGKLIDDLLAFARVGRTELQTTQVNLDELVRDALFDFQAETQARNLAWEIDALPPVRADRSLLRMALVNLISNAVKFTGLRAEAKIEIGCASSRDGSSHKIKGADATGQAAEAISRGETVIFIRDNGAGFDQNYAEKLFGAFQRLHSQAEFEGTGIGLANVQRIIHRHGGRTWAEGEVDRGATFYFSLPAENGAPQPLINLALPATNRPHSKIAEEFFSKSKSFEMKSPLHILHLEDEPKDAALVQSTLEAEGIACATTCVRNRDEFVAALEQGGVDLILSDFSLPSFDGVSAAQIVRAQWPAIPLILVSGTLGEELAIESLKSGATDYVLKERLARLAPAVRRAMQEVQERAERRRVEAQFIEAQKMEVVGHLAGGVAHDFNNILAVIMGYSDLLRTELGPDGPLGKYAEEIRLASQRAAALTRQLLVFSRKQTVQPAVVDLNGVVNDLDKMLRRLIDENIEMTIVPGKQIGRVKVDSGYIGQLLMNLVINARDAMPNGGKLTIAINNVMLDENCAALHAGAMAGDYVMLSVCDTGTGMTDEVKARLFEAFFTTKPKGKGTGLGLSTCQTIVQQSGGHISVHSELGKGTTFKIYFPRVDQPLDAAALPVGSPGTELEFAL